MDSSDDGARDFRPATFSYVARRSFGVAETVVVALIVLILAGGANRAYHDYARVARTMEGKMLAAALWSAIHTNATSVCGRAVVVSTMFAKAGLDMSGASESARWAVSHGAFNAVMVDCTTGAISPNGDIFTLRGQAEEVRAFGVKLTYTAATAHAVQFHCTSDGGDSFSEC
jgi:hypothetical protein